MTASYLILGAAREPTVLGLNDKNIRSQPVMAARRYKVITEFPQVANCATLWTVSEGKSCDDASSYRCSALRWRHGRSRRERKALRNYRGSECYGRTHPPRSSSCGRD